MGEKTSEIINSIKNSLREGPKSISEISKDAKINWRTAEDYLKLLNELGLVIEEEIKNTRTFLLKEKDNYFDLPVKKEDSKTISTIYYFIRKFCLQIHKTEPTKTQAYKILWKINQKLKKNLPVGWYMYGPICVQKYMNGEGEKTKLDKKTITLIKEVTEDYCSCDNIQLQNKIYKEVNDKFYQAKEKLTLSGNVCKEDINPILMDLIKFSPPETIEVVTDFARATLLLKWEKTKELFNNVWKYLAMVKLKESLQIYYGGYINIYLNKKIEEAKKEAQILITDLVRCNLKSK